jgi:hypothetical protein
MRKSTLFFATMLGLSLVGCTPDYTPTQAGGSGDEVESRIVDVGHNGWGCLWTDTNCNAFSTDPGGGGD